MIKRIIIFAIIFSPGIALANQWILFERPEQACYNKNGKVVDCNIPKHHYGGGWIQPRIKKDRINGWYENGKYLLLNLNITQETAQNIIDRDIVRIIPNTHKIRKKRKGKQNNFVISVRKYNTKMFNAIICSSKDAEQLIKDWGLWVDPISGVSD